VISNSWGQQLPTNAVTWAIDKARTRGRGGKGCVIVVAAGNSGGRVLFPASLPDVLTVSASNEYDEAKTATSADGETFWASCNGPEIDVAAPGVHNLTTDITGPGGYAPGNYAPAFNGTSSATPLVAGACALLLSKRPNLSEAQVRQVIVATADKVGQFPYANGRNDYMGNGRLNLLAAINAI
jgi:subtilisin family serine protease